MNFCMKQVALERNELIIDGLKYPKDSENVDNLDEFQQNCTKVVIPTQTIRPSSLTKISHSNSQSHSKNTNNTSFIQSGKKLARNNGAKNENTNEKLKKNIENSTKQVIFNKLLQKNQVSTKASTNITNKQNHNQKQNPNLPPDSFYHKHQNVNKFAKMYQQKTEKELQQCTFNPKIFSQNSDRYQGSKQFYKQQIERSQKTSNKIQQMREMIKSQREKENTFKPKLSQQTIELTQRRANKNIYQRLYHKKGQVQEEPQREDELKQCETFRRQKFKNSISLVSSSKKRNENRDSKQRNIISTGKSNNQSVDNRSKQLKNQKSIKKFQEIFQIKEMNVFNERQKRQQNKYEYPKWEKPHTSGKQSIQNSQKKPISSQLVFQKLDCQFLLQQKQKKSSSNTLTRQQSCRLLSTSSKEKIGNSKTKYDNQQWVKSKDGLQLKNKTSQKSLKIALEKFVKELFVVCSKLGFQSMIDLNQMVELMKNLNFIENSEQFYESPPDAEMKIKVFEIWTLLQGAQSGTIFLPNLLKILIAIQGFTNTVMIEQVFKSISQTLNTKQIMIIQSKSSLVLSEKDSKIIKKDFMNFYLTRFKLGQSKLFTRQLSNDHKFTFHPSISKQTQQYADKYREKIIEQSQQLLNRGLIEFDLPENGLIDHSTLMLLDQIIKTYRLQQKRQQSIKQKIRIQNKSMQQNHSLSNKSINQTTLIQHQKRQTMKTEQEIISNNTLSRISSHNNSHSRSKGQIFNQLYQQGRKSKSNKRNKSTEQVQFQSNKNQLTFKPKINQTKTVTQFKQFDLHQIIPNFTKEVMRMRLNKNLQKQQLSISPLLYLNVTMEGNLQTKIPIFQTDTFQQIVEKVRVIMKIKNGEQQKDNLKRILKEQIIPVLNQLGIYQKEGRFFQTK